MIDFCTESFQLLLFKSNQCTDPNCWMVTPRPQNMTYCIYYYFYTFIFAHRVPKILIQWTSHTCLLLQLQTEKYCSSNLYCTGKFFPFDSPCIYSTVLKNPFVFNQMAVHCLLLIIWWQSVMMGKCPVH